MNDELVELLDKIEKCKDKYRKTKKRLQNITKKYEIQLEELEKELDEYYSQIYKKELIKISVKDLIDELIEQLNVKDAKVEISLRGFFMSSLNEDEDKKEAFEKIKLKYQKNQWDDMKISIHNSDASKLLFHSILHFNMNVNSILSDGSKLIDNFDINDVEISNDNIFGKKSGIILIGEDVLLKTNLTFDYENLMDNSEYDEEYCYPSVKILREAIFNVLNKNDKINIIRK